jgi:hypothetical protein
MILSFDTIKNSIFFKVEGLKGRKVDEQRSETKKPFRDLISDVFSSLLYYGFGGKG